MFTLGVFVGRGLAPVQFDVKDIENKLAALREDLTKYKTSIDEKPYKTSLDFYSELKKDSNRTNKKDGKSGRISGQESNLISDKTGSNIKKPWTSQKVRTININKNQGGKNGFAIQVASLRNFKDATEMVRKLEKKGYNAYIAIANIPGKGIWYRVRIGHYERQKDAAVTLMGLKKEKYHGIIVAR